ncbi:hypothetical protein LCGC14_1031680 [marine sediment metagenome]|uniref:Uncharacterized protein n=1 Tax=marine sediment metagenome TaxID=412755 RepID=A0A0F9MYZ1_9ZZZZ
MGITLSLAVCRIIYILHFGVDMPNCVTYQSAANQVFDVVGWKAFDKLVAQAKALETHYVKTGNVISPRLKASIDNGSV